MRMVAVCVGLLLLPGACAEVQLASHATKEATGELYTTSELAGLGGKRKIGKPYQIAGAWYHPKEDPGYDQTGIASWYGPGFHGKSTANGERFDQYKISAAHTTLPMPSLVRVTNIDNGRSLVIRVNDRGPFAHGRIIDLSRRAAQLLGFERQGTAKVRVQALDANEGIGGGDIQVAQAGVGLTPAELQSPIVSSPRTSVTAQALAPLEDAGPGRPAAARAVAGTVERQPATSPETFPATTSPEISRETSLAAVPEVKQYYGTTAPKTQLPAAPDPRLAPGANLEGTLAQGVAQPGSAIFVQAGAFTERENANRLSSKLGRLAAAQVSPALVQGVEFFRVRLGPVADVATADRLLDQLEKLGHTNARIVVN